MPPTFSYDDLSIMTKFKNKFTSPAPFCAIFILICVDEKRQHSTNEEAIWKTKKLNNIFAFIHFVLLLFTALQYYLYMFFFSLLSAAFGTFNLLLLLHYTVSSRLVLCDFCVCMFVYYTLHSAWTLDGIFALLQNFFYTLHRWSRRSSGSFFFSA